MLMIGKEEVLNEFLYISPLSFPVNCLSTLNELLNGSEMHVNVWKDEDWVTVMCYDDPVLVTEGEK